MTARTHGNWRFEPQPLSSSSLFSVRTRRIKILADSKNGTDDSDSFVNSLSVRVEYYRSFEYCLKWKTSMHPQRFSGRQKASKMSPTDEDVIQRRLRSQKRRTWLRKPEASYDTVDTDEDGGGHSSLDMVNSTFDIGHAAEEAVEVTDKGLDESDEDRVSVCSSLASGPAVLNPATPKKPRPSQGLCSTCQRLYQKAKRSKTSVKDKLLDNDPKSLTCDEWVLLKRRTPRRPAHAGRKLLSQLPFNKHAMECEQRVGGSSRCSRQHPFLQRNLRCVEASPNKRRKKSRRKPTQPWDARTAKLQRLQKLRRQIGVSRLAPDPSSCQETDTQSDTDLTMELIPFSVNLETTEPREVRPKQEAPKKTGFRELLVKLRGSTIVRETH